MQFVAVRDAPFHQLLQVLLIQARVNVSAHKREEVRIALGQRDQGLELPRLVKECPGHALTKPCSDGAVITMPQLAKGTME